MTEEEVLAIKRKYEICNSYIRLTDSQLAYALRETIREGKPGWSYYKGHCTYPGYILLKTEPSNVSLEEFLLAKNEDGSWSRHNLFSTFLDCIDVLLVEDSGETVVLIKIWDGDSYDGHRTHIRCEFYLKGPWWTVKSFQECVEREWLKYTQSLVEQEELARLELRRKEISDLVLAGQYCK